MTFGALLAARAHIEGRAQPTALFRHRAIADAPIGIVAWQLGAEPYSVGAIAIGQQSTGFQAFVPGYPLNRDLLFAALLDFAKIFCGWFDSFAAGQTVQVSHHGGTLAIPAFLPQIIVPNRGMINLLGHLGRRLAYLPTVPQDGKKPADLMLPRLGRHLIWIADHAQVPGQQLILPAGELLTTHYTTALSPFEAQSLPAMNAWIDPPTDVHGFAAAELAERRSVGPLPDPGDARIIFELMQDFNQQRAGSTDPKVIAGLIPALRGQYVSMIEFTWDLMWEVIDRERKKPVALSVDRRVTDDRVAYAEHMLWMNGPAGGRRKTRMTHRATGMRLHDFERAKLRLEAEEAIDDPLRMAPHLLLGRALAGTVIQSNSTRKELVNGRNCLRPAVTVRTDEPCLIPSGTELWWTVGASGREWRIVDVMPDGMGSTVTLILQTNRLAQSPVPPVGKRVCFSQYSIDEGYELFLPAKVPWTHQLPDPPADTDIEHTDPGGMAA